ncbi:MAG: rhodanese-like domain-containing protein [Gilvibacter sp.]
MKKLISILLIAVTMVAVNACEETKASEIEQITVDQMSEALKNDSIQLLDVRTTDEYIESHLENAHNICVTDNDFKEKAENLNRDEPVYVYCKKGGRSAKAAKILQEMGFTKIYDMTGGILLWEEAGLETKSKQSQGQP